VLGRISFIELSAKSFSQSASPVNGHPRGLPPLTGPVAMLVKMRIERRTESAGAVMSAFGYKRT